MSFLRIVYKMAGFDSTKFPKDIEYEQFRKWILGKVKGSAGFLIKIIEFIANAEIPKMREINQFIKKCLVENRPYFESNLK